jgi:hypothetical protein
MRSLVISLAFLTFAAGCSTSSSKKPSIPEPNVAIEQLIGPRDLTYPEAPIEVQYAITIENRADIPLTLIRLDIRTVNPLGGAYVLQQNLYNFHQVIPPKSAHTVTFWAKAYSFGRGPRENEPVTVRGIVYFDSPSGATQKVFVRELSQYPD